MDKRFLAVVAAIILLFVGIAVFNRDDSADTANTGGSSGRPTNHIKGKADASVTLVEYGDFQCPVCRIYEPTVNQVVEKYGDRIKFQFRHFPLQQIHENALAGSRAAEAAGLQGKFWEMHDLLYNNQDVWSRSATPQSTFEQFAKSLSLNTEQYKKDFTSSKVNNAVNADLAEGAKLEITGTPAFFLNGKAIPNKQLADDQNQPQLDKFSKLIDEALAAKQ
jgi:protein-disulfide isomerase